MRNLLFSWLFFMPTCYILFSVGNFVVCGRCLEGQQALLLELKNNLKFNPSSSKKLVQWNEDVDYCNWGGVSCDDGCVIGLDLSNESISGVVGNLTSLVSLRFIRSLNLAYNSFNFTIPSGFEKLSNLTVLNMSNAGFGGQVPIGISRLTRLVTLDISSSSVLQVLTLKLENPNLKTLIQNLNNLQELRLDGVNISAGGNEWCKAISSSLPNLRVLSLSGCLLSGPIDSSLAKLQQLSFIRLDNNNLSSSVPENFSGFSNLTMLHLATCGLSGIFPQSIFQVSTLLTLDLSYNSMLQGSLPDFQINGSLQILMLEGTNFSGILPESIVKFENLTRVDMQGCNFSGLIPNSIGNLRRLSYLDLSNNKFEGPIPSFSLLKSLSILNIAHNRLNGSMVSTKWEELKELVNLDLSNNLLNGVIPLSLFRLPSIQKIQLSSNQFNCSFNELSNVSTTQLDTLALDSNHLGGPFPFSFLKFQGLKILSLSFNNFTGPLNLNMFSQLKNLSKLELSSNNLSVDANFISSSFPQLTTLKLASCKLRRFPGFLKNLSKLNSLDLSHNELEGIIPPWIWEIGGLRELNLSCNSLVSLVTMNPASKLYVLDLHSNKLEGKIPSFPPSASVAYLDISNNRFSSVIPTDLGSLSSLVFFSLSENQIEGSIPQSICNATRLQVLDLSNNNMSGVFPECLTKLTVNLVVLDLRSNRFNGSIPDTFPVTCSLRTLDLSGNKIEGKVPQSLSNCHHLEVLDIGNNQINDVFPCPLKNISTLRVLVLRSNQFHGIIGCRESPGTWRSLQIVDLARNNFTGPVPGECLKKWKAMADEEEDSKSKLNHLRFDFFKFSSVNYQDTITVTIKGMEMELSKILTVFTSIDFSCNQFNGSIPPQIGELRALYLLNLSHNSFSGEIPPSIGNLSQLGSLDLSRNFLTGTIPSQLANLFFLSALNLSYNRLVGKIPIGAQIQLFLPDSFVGNAGLCGPPLSIICSSETFPSSNPQISTRSSESEYYWQVVVIGVGIGVGAAATVAPLTFLQVGRKWSDDIVDRVLLAVLPLMGMIYTTSRDRNEKPDDDECKNENDESIDGFEDVGNKDGSTEIQGQYCVFCSNIDSWRTRVIHSPHCTCLCSLYLSSSPSSSFPLYNRK